MTNKIKFSLVYHRFNSYEDQTYAAFIKDSIVSQNELSNNESEIISDYWNIHATFTDDKGTFITAINEQNEIVATAYIIDPKGPKGAARLFYLHVDPNYRNQYCNGQLKSDTCLSYFS